MTARTAARAFHQFGNMLLAIAALGFVAALVLGDRLRREAPADILG
jgi:hypothetical protein